MMTSNDSISVFDDLAAFLGLEEGARKEGNEAFHLGPEISKQVREHSHRAERRERERDAEGGRHY